MSKKLLWRVLVITLTLSYTVFAVTVDWWENSSLYQIYPKSWKDSDGNGIGDIKGITEKLDYLKEIGITASWLSPIFKSPMVDNGYDISNFTEIDPIFGTLDDFDAMVKKFKELDLKIILDFVPNHSSDECEWFQKSINREDGYENFYVWADGLDDPQNPGQKLPPSNWVSKFGGSMWTWNEKRQQFYLHQFFKQQPDFNFRNEKVSEKMLGVLKFWLDRGVDGFRIDAVPYLFEKVNQDGTFPDEEDSEIQTYTQNQDETFELLYNWRDFLESYKKQNGGDTRILIAETYQPIEMIDRYCGNGTHQGAQIPLNLNLRNVTNDSNARDVKGLVDNWMNVIWKKHQTANWLTGNHDIKRVIERVGKNKTNLMYFLLTGLPGVTITYYGEEIGMSNVGSGNVSKQVARAYARSPFQWNDDISAGFSSSNKTWLPVANNYKIVNVKNQLASERSSLKVFIALQKLKQTPAFKALKEQNGFSYEAVNDNVFQIMRHSPDEEYRILINFGENEEDIGEILSSKNGENNLMEYTVVSENSPHNIGDKVKLGKVKLMPFEGVALKKVTKTNSFQIQLSHFFS